MRVRGKNQDARARIFLWKRLTKFLKLRKSEYYFLISVLEIYEVALSQKMEIEYQFTKKDYTEFARAYCKTGLQKRLWAITLVTVVAAMCFGQTPFNLQTFLIGTAASVIFLLTITYFVPLLIFFRRTNKLFATEKSVSEKKKLTVTEQGLLIESESRTTSWNWESIKYAGAVGEFICISLADKSVAFFRKSFFQFLCESDALNFWGLVQGKVAQISQPLKYPLANANKRPPYWLGLLCLIPVFGAVVGIVLLLNGISKYKDKWIIMMGAGGIIYTFALVLFFANPLNKGMRAAFAPHAQMAVNDLMKGVEFYKLKHGVYPDSLEQIKDGGINPMLSL